METGLERYLTRILDQVAEGIAIVDADGRYSYANDQAEQILQTPRDVIIGRRYDDPVWQFTEADGTAIPIEEMPVSVVMRTGREILNTVYGALLPDESSVKLTINAVPFTDDGKMVGTLVSFNDITRRERLERLDHALNEVAVAVNSTFEYDSVIQRGLEVAVDALGCETGAVFVKEDSDWVIRYLRNLPEDMRGVRVPEKQAAFTLLSGNKAGAVAFNDAYRDERIDNRLMRRYRIKSLLDVTLRVQDLDVGDISFIHHSKAVPFTQDDIDFANKFGALVALALENSELYTSEQQTSHILQRALVGDPVVVAGLPFSHAYRSGTKSAFVGGDFYDLFEVGPDRVAVLLGDVSGKGLPKATIAALAKDTMIAYLLEGETPTRVVERAHHVIFRSTNGSTFITAVVGVLHKASGVFEYCNAGHPDPLVLRSDGHVERLTRRSPLLGAVPDTAFEQAETTLQPGEVLMLYTDGVTEARNADGAFFGDERTEAMLKASRDVPVTELADHLLQRVSDFAGGQLSDDVAILALGRLGE